MTTPTPTHDAIRRLQAAAGPAAQYRCTAHGHPLEPLILGRPQPYRHFCPDNPEAPQIPWTRDRRYAFAYVFQATSQLGIPWERVPDDFPELDLVGCDRATLALVWSLATRWGLEPKSQPETTTGVPLYG